MQAVLHQLNLLTKEKKGQKTGWPGIMVERAVLRLKNWTAVQLHTGLSITFVMNGKRSLKKEQAVETACDNFNSKTKMDR